MSTKDFLEKDYYKALGVAKTAKPAEIKAAYRKLARKYHPDANKGDASAEERFKEISEAYSVLSDEKRRKEYDEARSLFGGGFRVPTGQAYVPIESPRGELGAHVVSDGGTRPFRAHFRDPSFVNLQAIPAMSEGGMVADIIAAVASLDPVMGGVDR